MPPSLKAQGKPAKQAKYKWMQGVAASGGSSLATRLTCSKARPHDTSPLADYAFTFPGLNRHAPLLGEERATASPAPPYNPPSDSTPATQLAVTVCDSGHRKEVAEACQTGTIDRQGHYLGLKG